ncbi:nucleoside 2-deoxyribosyltransferase [Desulfovibrio sp. TomC]|uniref:nucleoside 2-deoxyribosyltransferase n=1 Tax=Desulfovibrio sp. TomC TaxID=1562888 RepID=UPI0005BA6712|nr:nucleoside 2-deoxyribosyltransferase [Desulfovibrio sp. TomC]
MKIYQAGPLFTEADRDWHKKFTSALNKEGHTAIWPGDLFDEEHLLSLGSKAKEHIFEKCRNTIDECDIVVALLDGTQVDDGTSWEIGYAFAKNIPIFGIRTDFRNGGDTSHSMVNCMIECSCKAIATSISGLLELL